MLGILLYLLPAAGLAAANRSDLWVEQNLAEASQGPEAPAQLQQSWGSPLYQEHMCGGNIGPHCKLLPCSNTDVQVQVCAASEETFHKITGRLTKGAPLYLQSRSGAFVFERAASAPLPGQDVFRVRLIGHEILLLDMHVCNNSLVVAPYEVLIGGAYHVEVMHLFQNFTLAAHPQHQPVDAMLLASLTLVFYSADEAWGCAWERDYPLCSSGEAQGRWTVRHPSLLGNLSRCHPADHKGPASADGACRHVMRGLAVNKSAIRGIEWQPYACRLAAPHEFDRQACIKAYGQYPLPASCTDVLLNFGHWPATQYSGRTFWPPQQYALALEDAGNRLTVFRHEGKRVYWVSSIPQQSKAGHTGVRDWRSEPVISLYNELSRAHFAELGIPFIDMSSIVGPLQDLSYDSSHFKGIVGFFMDLRILNILCWESILHS